MGERLRRGLVGERLRRGLMGERLRRGLMGERLRRGLGREGLHRRLGREGLRGRFGWLARQRVLQNGRRRHHFASGRGADVRGGHVHQWKSRRQPQQKQGYLFAPQLTPA